ncbi:MAG: nucleoside phosphorylase [Theionarchaea archaeon]|nr:nucleoside phosphorylase [Theionarchaea archaeon]MBU7038633.1 nucleoside phosphorylase [Theionarchaea archaeon]
MSNKRCTSPDSRDTQYHIQCGRDDLTPYVLLPGDPQRVLKIASLWDTFHEVRNHREFRSVRGKYEGRDISCVSTGIGSPSAGIVVEELARIGCHTLIRVGSTGVIQDIPCGDLIINTGSVRFEGTSKDYVCAEYPALSHYEVILSLVEACERLKYAYHLGIGATTNSFFVGQAREGFNGYFPSRYRSFIEDLHKAKILNFEMETASVLTLGSLFGLRAGAICAVFANRVTGEFRVTGEEKAGKAASEAVKILQEWDERKRAMGKNWIYPSLLQ